MFTMFGTCEDIHGYYVKSRKKPESVAVYPVMIIKGQPMVVRNLLFPGIFITFAVPPDSPHHIMYRSLLKVSTIVLRGKHNRRAKYTFNIPRRGGNILNQAYKPKFAKRRKRRSDFRICEDTLKLKRHLGI